MKNEVMEAVTSELTKAGVEYQVRHGSKHDIIVWATGQQVVSKGNGDWRARQNAIHETRRKLMSTASIVPQQSLSSDKIKRIDERIDGISHRHNALEHKAKILEEHWRAAFTALEDRILRLELQIAELQSKPAPTPMAGFTAKRMAADLGISGNYEATTMLKLHARSFCATNKLEIKRGPGKHSYEYFPAEAAEYAKRVVRTCGLFPEKK